MNENKGTKETKRISGGEGDDFKEEGDNFRGGGGRFQGGRENIF